MKAQDIISYVNSLVPYVYYPFSFPKTADDEVAVITVGAGMPTDVDTNVSYPTMQILVRGEARDFDKTEAKALEIFDALKNKVNQSIGDESVVVIKPSGSSPFFIGLDENERPIFTQNFNLVIRPQK